MVDSEGNTNSTGPAHNDFRSGIIRKTEYFDLFISYKRDNGGDHGQQLAERLYKDLTAKGFKVWLDNEEIGFSRDFEKRIEEAILHSKKFACVLSPLWLASENCRYEYKKALEFEKRIVPIHYKGFRDELRQQKVDGILSESEWRRLDKPQEINFSQEAFYQKALEDLAAICRLKDEVTTEHTRILCESYYWQNFDQPQGMLLRGTRLTKAKRLKQRCNGDEESPTFAALQNEFLKASTEFVNTEVSRKRKVFIDFQESDRDLATELDLELRINNISTWFDDFGKKESDESVFVDAILNSQTVVHVTNEQVEDDDLKLAFARSNNKRILQITSSKEVLEAHQEKGEKNIYLWSEGRSLDEITTSINGDASHVAAHAELLEKAYLWEAEGKSDSKLLYLQDANNWKDWYQKAEADGSEPPPNLKMIDFVERSIVYSSSVARRKRMVWWTTLIGIILLVGMTVGFFSLYYKVQAENERLDRAKNEVRIQKEKSAKEKALLEELRHQHLEDSIRFVNDLNILEIQKAESEQNQEIAEAKLDSAQIKLNLAAEKMDSVEVQVARLEDSKQRLLKEKDKLIAERKKVEDELEDITEKKDALNNYLQGRTLAISAYQNVRFQQDSSAAKDASEAVDLLTAADASVQLQPLYEVGKNLVDDSTGISEATRMQPKSLNSVLNALGATEADLYPANNSRLPKEEQNALADKLNIPNHKVALARNGADGKYAALALKNGEVKLFSLEGDSLVDSYRNHTHRVTDVVFNESMTYMCVASVDNSFSIVPILGTKQDFGNAEIIEQTTEMRITKLYFLENDVVIGISELGAKAWGISVTKLLEMVANEN